MKKSFLVIFSVCFIVFLTSCSEFGGHKEKYNIGDIPPEVVRVYSLPSSYPMCVITAYPNTFEDFEKEVTESSLGKVIFECEMVEGGTLIKSFKNNNERNLGNYCSFVLTPVRITKIHFQDDDCEITVKEGDIVYVKENYFWVTSDMEEVLEDYDEGTYLTISGYYPMMLGEKYIVYADDGELNDYGVNSEKPVMYPHRDTAVYCISENIIHTRRQKVYGWPDEIYQAGAWLKYSGKTEFKYEYADVFGEEENVIKVSHVDKTPITTYRSFEEKKEAFKDTDNGNGVIAVVSLKEKGHQVSAPDIEYLSDYDYCTVSDVKIVDVLYTGEKSSSSIRQKMF